MPRIKMDTSLRNNDEIEVLHGGHTFEYQKTKREYKTYRRGKEQRHKKGERRLIITSISNDGMSVATVKLGGRELNTLRRILQVAGEVK